MALIRVTAAQVKRTSEQLRSYNDHFNKRVGDLVSAEGKLSSMWDGEANDAFHTAFNNDKEYMMQFYNLINRYCEALDNIAAEYEAVEKRAADLARTRKF